MAEFFFKIAPHNGAMNYFDSAIGNDILSVHYQIGGGFLQKLRGKCVNFISLQIKHISVGKFQYER